MTALLCGAALLFSAPAMSAQDSGNPDQGNPGKGPDLTKYDFAIGDLTYKILDADTKTVEVAALPNPKNPDDIPLIAGDVVIPATVTNEGVTYQVKQVRYFGFKNSFNMTSLTIEEGVEYVDTAAFWGSHIETLKLPSSMKTIGFMGFFSCKKLEKIVVPEGCEEVGPYAFEHCEAAKEIILPQSLKRIQFGAFIACKSLKGIDIPPTITRLGGAAFYNCTNLLSITFPDGLETINGDMCGECHSLREVNIPESVTGLNGFAFLNCYMLEHIKLPSRLDAIWRGVFKGCASLQEIELPQRVWILSMDAFMGCESLESINIPVRIKDLGANVLNGCTSLKRLYIDMPDAVIPSIEKYYSGLETLTFGPNVKTISIEKQSDGPWYYMNHTIIADPATPPTATEQIFQTWDYDNAELLVPAASLDLYKAAEPWKNFLKSSGINSLGADNDNEAPATYFDLQGRRVDQPSNGIFITSQGRKVLK